MYRLTGNISMPHILSYLGGITGNLETGLDKEKLYMFLEKAEQRKPELLHTVQVPAALIAVEKEGTVK